MSIEWIMSACIGVGLAACCGFRVFVPLLIASVATKLGFIGTVTGFEWLSDWPALFGLAIATIFEIGAYYIPWLDNILDTIATPLSIIAGTILSTSFLHIDNSVIHWGLGLMLGGSSAGIVQAGTSLLRLGSSATTGGVANPIVATGENAASVGLSLFTIFLPLVAVVIIGAVLIFIIGRLLAKRKVWFSRASSKQAGNPITQIPRSSNGRA
ncbi:DUF4126 domain-containing protein [Spirosoma agri]|jgi:uncharacterized membrane protein|uniref:DUF4126 domain-containing protein n=1 Tax=Spirosoma agri TaxID=1987381 RepID=A0A6M0IID9_9BACT|nr:DUF4126 domain-containing protein [Spirosoma agri]NEU67602.1 DUF4126 domain-containing protein [Spirosoma agri]